MLFSPPLVYVLANNEIQAYQETQDLVGHHAQFGASRVIATDGILIPTGKLIEVEDTPLDFRKAKSIGGSINATAEAQYCGTGEQPLWSPRLLEHSSTDFTCQAVWDSIMHGSTTTTTQRRQSSPSGVSIQASSQAFSSLFDSSINSCPFHTGSMLSPISQLSR